jgi:hypothetical protein
LEAVKSQAPEVRESSLKESEEQISGGRSPLVQLHRTKVGKLRTLQEEENRRLELLEERSLQERVEPGGGPSCIGISGLASASIACTMRSRVVISRLKRDRRFECGQVARDPAESGFGTSAVSTLKGARRNRESGIDNTTSSYLKIKLASLEYSHFKITFKFQTFSNITQTFNCLTTTF